MVTRVADRWSWGSGLARSFDEHAEASIPLYRAGHELTVELSDWFVAAGSTVYDIGSSTGGLTAALGALHPDSTVIGIDSEPQMTAAAERRCSLANVSFVTGDVLTVRLAPAALVTAHHVLPFLTAQERTVLLRRVHEALVPGSAMVLFEKTMPTDPRTAMIAASALTSRKLASGLAADEIVAKDRSLRGVMRPRTVPQIVDELQAAGFESVTSVMRWLNWDGLLAVKSDR